MEVVPLVMKKPLGKKSAVNKCLAFIPFGWGIFAGMKRIGNILFYGALIFVFLYTPTRSWILQQVLSTGLFNKKIDSKETLKQPAKPFAFKDMYGKDISSNDLKGKVVFINFWATWCPPCRAEMPSLQKLYDELKNDPGIVFLFMNEDENRQKALDFLAEKKYSMPFYTANGMIPEEIYSGTLPTTVVLDKEGKIVYQHEGIGNFNNDDFMKQLRELAKK